MKDKKAREAIMILANALCGAENLSPIFMKKLADHLFPTTLKRKVKKELK